MTRLNPILFPATDADQSARRCKAARVATRTLVAYVLGAVLRGVALHGRCDYQWEGISDVEAVELEAVIQEVVNEVACQSEENAFRAGDDLYRPIESPACDRAREILSRADVQRALDALIAALLIHVALTGVEAAEIILMAFTEE